MQQLDKLENKTLDSGAETILAALQDISTKVTIQSNFSISHPDYKPLEVSPEVAERLQQLPKNIQDNYLNSLLCGFLYGIYYNGALKSTLAPNADTVDGQRLQNLENNTFLGVDLGFYDRLHTSNHGEGFFDPDWQIIKQENDGSLAVKKGNLTLHIERERHLQTGQTDAQVGDMVAIRMPRNLVQNGFYMAIGNAGRHSNNNSHNSHAHEILVRVYFNLNPEGAVKVMESLTTQLNTISLPFSFKALYNPGDYGRYDAAVLYFEKSSYTAIEPVLKSIYTKHKSHFGAEVPLFTKIVAPGLAIAEEPDRKFSTEESFGLNRCHLVANGCLAAWRQGNQSSETRLKSILQQFDLAGLEWQRPYLNAHSEDIYRVSYEL
ncbi:MAG: T3SS effector HopA1 family protein [Calothrix sp. MO_192.B10]|nr:T3SS effector HopA1 family protein [Calothrix sp. MO_192.B10]